MVDVNSVTAALGSIKAASDIAKVIKESGSTLEKAETRLQIAELVSSLADAKLEVASIQNDLISKDQELADLKKALELKESVFWEAPSYWVNEVDGKDGPFCQRCYDKEVQLIRLQVHAKGSWRCYSCNSYFEDGDYESFVEAF
ncbi:hypothetical protein [Idiomarina sp. OXR-189]|uniref:hypothetical protein n=1 Tax=Idiomarina sp. OXR-189 TaxID=3100175 RepID=UPI002AC8F34F|nr:hypothetical protein [Idiomarina sp. OXR-189]WPZ02535.1 hypothetical protein UM402_06430 [Idiomarina sp. OXR-189]